MPINNVPSQSTDKKYIAALEAKLREQDKRLASLEARMKNQEKRK